MIRRHRPAPRPVDLGAARAHWVRSDLVALPATALPHDLPVHELTVRLEHAPDGGLDPGDRPGPGWDLRPDDGGLPPETLRVVPHLAGALALRLPDEASARAARLLTGQVALTVRHRARLVMATSLQVPHVLDDLYAAQARRRRYGATWGPAERDAPDSPDRRGAGAGAGAVADLVPTVTVWAPTAREVTLLLWDAVPPEGSSAAWTPPGDPVRHPLARSDDGAWSVTGASDWRDRCYQLELRHVIPPRWTEQVVRTTDPWSVALTLGSTHSVLVALDDPRWVPPRWAQAPVPPRLRPVDQSIYELHVRDFSRDDPEVPPELRGTYRAFGVDGLGRRHLRTLAGAGLNTVHLLPVFDLTSVPEDPAERVAPDPEVLAELTRRDPAGTEQQQLVRRTAHRDAFNWGYDPWHFLAPEGSYATGPGAAHGGRRVAECREMVGALHELGLRVVLDQVYNHTTDSGLERTSVLDRVVPGYYHRLDEEGRVETSTCCQNLATEHQLAEQLMVDGCVLWVRHYRVDGFRFDLMGHHSRANLDAVRAALDALTPAQDGVDGSAVTLYGEGWNFGEVAGDARFPQAVQGQLDGTGIGTFNDRLRDAVRGGAVHDDSGRSGHGWVTGGSDPHDTDLLQVGLAGGLRDLRLLSHATGRWTTGAGVPYGGAPGGYAAQPDEVVSYVDAHDNETLWDTLLLKLSDDTPMAERVRRNTLALACVTLSQGISFWHAGAEILRSKSLDRNSYDSGDWFNVLDWSLQDNGFGRGLPPEPDNGRRWAEMAPLLADPSLRPTPADARTALDGALDLLRLRRDLPLLRLGTAEQILAKVSFPLSGPQGRADLVVMLVDDLVGAPVDPVSSGLLVVLNASREEQVPRLPGLAGQHWELSAVQQEGADPVVRSTRWEPGTGRLVVPGLSAAVLVRRG
ncbi:pullulanase-type alpha-1,6-glucosidase [Ornithinimicrobium sp. W1679]|uniref:pullulanase-type alpha-1,6-glucosidase n=1 Tax=Ornithinimicrobium sp. W1679 TaxID=3418770 RepID=UPI003CF0C149